eukprot:Phypoly_transcript_06305.p1 GENE.Phypoly_transcript_06305~~Phypoly_transcript_06305.p1  ORF type:complete len:513 (+),score=52.02 Phypoly_transcript_06305:77-1540(+)
MDDLGDMEPTFVPGSSALETPLAHEVQQADEPQTNSNGVEENVVSVDVLETDDSETSSGQDSTTGTAAALYRKYSDEDTAHPNWASHKKHIFLVSNSGRPIYTRYGDEFKLASFMASINAIISFVGSQDEDALRYICAGDHKIVFNLKDPIYLIAVACTGEPVTHLYSQLEYTYAHIISILTNHSILRLKSRPKFDLRNQLGGTDKILDCLMKTMDNDPSFMLHSIFCLRMPAVARNALANILYNVHPPDLLFSFLISDHQLVSLIRPKKNVVNPQDLHLVMNFVNSSSAFKTSESWTPFCLPNFNANSFMHAYVCYLTTDLFLVLMSVKPESFYKLSECKNAIWKEVTSNPDVIDPLNAALRNPTYSVSDIEIPSLLHFLYKAQSTSQFTAPKFEPPYDTPKERKRLLRLYQHVNHRVTSLGRPHKVYYLTTQTETIVSWVTSGFELYATFGPLESKPVAIKACNQLLRWIKVEENNLFILNSPVW